MNTVERSWYKKTCEEAIILLFIFTSLWNVSAFIKINLNLEGILSCCAKNRPKNWTILSQLFNGMNIYPNVQFFHSLEDMTITYFSLRKHVLITVLFSHVASCMRFQEIDLMINICSCMTHEYSLGKVSRLCQPTYWGRYCITTVFTSAAGV